MFYVVEMVFPNLNKIRTHFAGPDQEGVRQEAMTAYPDAMLIRVVRRLSDATVEERPNAKKVS
jgi:hypothetical protein